jgi:hypothetical protein
MAMSFWSLMSALARAAGLADIRSFKYPPSSQREVRVHIWQTGESTNFPLTSTAGDYHVRIYRGVDTSAPVDVSGVQNTSNCADQVAPSVTTNYANDTLVDFFTDYNDGNDIALWTGNNGNLGNITITGG